ncbi:glycosyltransferase family 4 protein [Thermanaeromonas sp. C210]|uniref:glycosyltransferase family 4 protein n=1 Tax=Thermanaeromonas sp. C210 TaxID=2731925 RepID=UPI00155D2861|nr:glycosyltransferase family 4 protein [Thermanaeromonas sp. C210]GFN23430.1 glycosyl transferase [Thermanaeromonas sp. C210]
MRIAMLHWAFPPIIGGVESHLALLCPRLVQQGHTVSLVTATAPGTLAYETWRGVAIRRSPLLDLNSLTPELIEAKAVEIRRVMEDFLLDFRPDVVHAHNFHYFSFVHASALQEICARHGWPLVLTAHNVWDDELWKRMNTLARGWDAVIAVSHYIRQELIVNGYPPERVVVVHHGIDDHAFQPPTALELQNLYRAYPALRGRRVIFHPARMSLAKGCDVSLRALDLIRRQIPDALLVMAGTSNTVDWGQKQPAEILYINQLIEELDLKDHVFVRFFPWFEMPQIYKGAEICWYPSSFQEPFGLVMLEAMASGKPIIVSRAGGMPEVVRPGYNGFLISPKDYEDLARYTIFLLHNPGIAANIGQNGRRMVEEHFTVEIMTRATLDVYQDTLGLLQAQTG